MMQTIVVLPSESVCVWQKDWIDMNSDLTNTVEEYSNDGEKKCVNAIIPE